MMEVYCTIVQQSNKWILDDDQSDDWALVTETSELISESQIMIKLMI